MQTFLSNRTIIEYLNSAHEGDSDAAKFGLNKTINVKCKNMKSYDLAFSVDASQLAPMTPMAILYCEPAKLPGGATLPTALFRDPQGGIDTETLRFLEG